MTSPGAHDTVYAGPSNCIAVPRHPATTTRDGRCHLCFPGESHGPVLPRPAFVPATGVAAAQAGPYPAAGAPAGPPIARYCSGCGRGLLASSVMCPDCGTPVHPGTRYGLARGKSKTVAVLLAVFLSFWTWLYTYDADKIKFWVSLAAVAVFDVLAMVTSSVLLSVLGVLAAFGVWLCAVIGRVAQPSDYYENYG